MSSGIEVDKTVVDAYNDLKKKTKIKMGDGECLMEYLTMKIKNKKEIVVDKTGECEGGTPEEKWNNFVQEFCKDKEPIYAVYDLKWVNTEKSGSYDAVTNQSKLVFIAWVPDTAPIGIKMIYASSKDALKKVLVGFHTELQANDADDTTFDHLMQKAKQKK